MGSCTFEHTAEGSDAKDAFRKAREAAKHEFGHGGYTGTIAEKHSFVMVARQPMRCEDALKLARDMIDKGDPQVDSKYGPAGCIELRQDAKAKARMFLFFGWASE